MDSGSSSMQSSSGGDEEYDSRADQSLSAFLDHPHHAGPPPPPPQHPPPPPPHNHHHHHHHHHQQQLHFDNPLLSNYFDNNPLSLSSSSFTFLPGNTPGSDPTAQPDLRGFATGATSSLPRPPPPPLPSQNTQLNFNNNSSNNNNNIGVVKKPKKRSRASRRAPTTVLTTDTSNFRAMVQEFTGIPAPLFTNNINTRLNNFFGLSPSPSYNLLRPFAHKLVPTTSPPLISSLSASSDAALRSSINQHLPNSSPSASADIYQNLNLQSLLQVPHLKEPVSSANPTSDHNNVKTNILVEDQFGLGGLQNTDPPSNTAATMLCRRDSKSSENGGYDDSDDNPLRLMTDNGRDDSSGMENVTATRNEGTIESWLCSSSDHRT